MTNYFDVILIFWFQLDMTSFFIKIFLAFYRQLISVYLKCTLQNKILCRGVPWWWWYASLRGPIFKSLLIRSMIYFAPQLLWFDFSTYLKWVNLNKLHNFERSMLSSLIGEEPTHILFKKFCLLSYNEWLYNKDKLWVWYSLSLPDLKIGLKF